MTGSRPRREAHDTFLQVPTTHPFTTVPLDLLSWAPSIRDPATRRPTQD